MYFDQKLKKISTVSTTFLQNCLKSHLAIGLPKEAEKYQDSHSLILMHDVGEIHMQGACQVYRQGAAGEVHGQSSVEGVHQLVGLMCRLVG